jgi:hypothetical protein
MVLALPSPAQVKPGNDKIMVASYYFPNYHSGDARNDLIKGPGWSEWELVRNARPRYEGHRQPLVPLWGYADEKDPRVMARKIRAASRHGIDAFIFDWYYYNDGPFLNRCLEEGFLKAKNRNRMKFALMWANHDWVDIHPYTLGMPQKIRFPGKVSSETYAAICDHLVKDFFSQPNYWLIEGKAYFSIYDIKRFVDNFGSLEATREAMEMLDAKANAAGLKGVHWNLVAWGNPVLPVENPPDNYPELIRMLGFDSTTSYVWVHHFGLRERENDYLTVWKAYLKHWETITPAYGVPYFPNITVGWDSSPRTNQDQPWDHSLGYPYTGIIVNNTPENFKKVLQATKEKLLADPAGARVVTINCWNEWTEGSCLEPEKEYRMKYLNAVKSVF